jgi:hypothetical protein
VQKLIIVVGFYLIAVSAVFAQTVPLKPTEAKNHIGERATVCGKVVSSRFAKSSKGEPTFLNLDEPYPKQVFTVVIWGENRDKFGAPDMKYKDAHICATGKIISYRDEPEITATEPDQISIQK